MFRLFVRLFVLSWVCWCVYSLFHVYVCTSNRVRSCVCLFCFAFVRASIRSFMYLLVHLIPLHMFFVRLFVPSGVRSCVYSFFHVFVRTSNHVCSCVFSFFHAFVRTFNSSSCVVCLFILSSAGSYISSFFPLFHCSLIHSFLHSFIPSFFHCFDHLLIRL